jgi:hypothetical protein
VEVSRREPLVVPEVEVGLGAVVEHEHLAVLERVHRAGVDVDVRVELLDRDLQSAGLERGGRGRWPVVMPLPRPEATPPVTKMNFGCAFTTGHEPSRGSRHAAAVSVADVSAEACFLTPGDVRASPNHRSGGTASITRERVTVSATAFDHDRDPGAEHHRPVRQDQAQTQNRS